MRTPDKIICAYLKKKEPKGMEYLFEEYYKPLVLWADTFLNNMPQAEDLVQEFFVKLWEQRPGDPLLPQTLKSYLYTSVRNRSLNLLDKNDPLRQTFEIDDAMNLWEEYNDSCESLMRKVEAAVEKLPPRSRDVVVRIYLRNMRYKEVAAELDISVATVKTLLVNSLKSLRKEMNADHSLLLFVLCKNRNKYSDKHDPLN